MVMDVVVCSQEDGVARWCRSCNGGCRLRLPWWPEVVCRFPLAVSDGSSVGFDLVLFWFAGSVADAVVLLVRSGARWCRDEPRP